MSDFWSRRKEAARVEAEAVEAARGEAEAIRAEADAAAEFEALPEAEQLARLGLPVPESVESGDDVAAFLAKAVPGALRNRALRALWRSNPVLANLDGLNDYDTDFRGDGLSGGVLRTSYVVGKGLAAHVKRLAEAESDRNDRKGAYENAQDNASQPPEKKVLAEDAPVVERSGPEASPGEGVALVESVPMPVRRMRFTFGEEPDE